MALRAKRQEERVRQALQHQHTPFPLVSNTNRHQKQQQQHQKMWIRQVRERLRQKTVTLCSDTHWCKFKASQTLEPSSVLTTPRHKNAHRWPKSNVLGDHLADERSLDMSWEEETKSLSQEEQLELIAQAID